MKRRHPNINNEILMEKRVLQNLDYPGIVTLLATFQDYGTLYYQMELVEGGDLWSCLQDKQYGHMDGGVASQVGCHWSLAKFYFAEALEAVEYMHRLASI